MTLSLTPSAMTPFWPSRTVNPTSRQCAACCRCSTSAVVGARARAARRPRRRTARSAPRRCRSPEAVNVPVVGAVGERDHGSGGRGVASAAVSSAAVLHLRRSAPGRSPGPLPAARPATARPAAAAPAPRRPAGPARTSAQAVSRSATTGEQDRERAGDGAHDACTASAPAAERRPTDRGTATMMTGSPRISPQSTSSGFHRMYWATSSTQRGRRW